MNKYLMILLCLSGCKRDFIPASKRERLNVDYIFDVNGNCYAEFLVHVGVSYTLVPKENCK